MPLPKPLHLHLSTSSSLIAAALTAMALAPAVHAADTTPATQEPITLMSVTIQGGGYGGGEKGTASAAAPTQANLDATQPQSAITRNFIEKSVAPTAEYSRIVNIAPSLSGDSANGPGLSETKSTLRGFSDDQYNVTFDGIPWGDTNNPAHHSTSFFPAATIGGAVVERGPGNASNLGFATFGGSINLYSKKPGRDAGVTVFGSLGNWNTRLLGVGYESGRLADMGDLTVQANIQHLQSDGYLTCNSIKSDNLTLKLERPIGDHSVLTLFATANVIDYTQPDNNKGPTLDQVAKFGKNYSLNNDPTSFNYAGFNHTTKNTDFDYARLRTQWSEGWSTEVQAYTYAYDNQTISSTDPTGLTAPGTKIGPVANVDVPGIDKQNRYRAYGVIAKASKDLSVGLLRFGLWSEHSDTDRHQYDIDLTLGNIRDPRETKPTPVTFASVLFDQQSTITSNQPFIEFEWSAAPGLTVTPGYKHVSIARSVDATVNQTTRLPQNASVTYNANLPFLTLNQQLGANLATYAQYAQGFQIPDLKSFYIANPTTNSSEPQTSTNYQVGLVGKSRDLTWDVDVYRIDFKNKYVSNGLAGTAAAFVNIGGATYKGIESQLTYMLTPSLALYANGSINRAVALDTGKQVSGAPDLTSALGLIYESGPWASSLISKRTGATRQVDYDATKPTAYDSYRVAAYNNLDLGLSYTFAKPGLGAKALKVQGNVFNLLNRQGVTAISAGKVLAGDQYTYQAPRSVQLSAKAEF